LSHRYCYLPLSWKSWNRFECAVGGVRRPDHDQQHCYHQAPTVNQRLLLQLLQLLMMGMMMPETCWAVFKRQVINLRSCCIWLVDSAENLLSFSDRC
jgi:hypothetical protein